MKRVTGILLAVSAATIVITPAAKADSWGVSNSCSAPYDRSNEYAVNSFKRCIERFVDEQKDAIETHTDALNDAIKKWNRFARGY